MKITLNLLPEEQKEYLRKQRLFSVVMQQISYVVVLLLIFIAILFAVDIVLDAQMSGQENALKNRQEEQGYKDLTEMQVLFKETNVQAGSVDRVQKHHFHWSQLMAYLEESIVGGVEFESINTEGAAVTIIGFARSRDALTQQMESLRNIHHEDRECLIDVQAADDDLFKKKDFDFTIMFTVNDQCLKKS